MNIHSISGLLGGIAFFLYGMNVMSSSLANISGGRLEKILTNITNNKSRGLCFGAAATVLLQSSSALTVMLVGLVNSEMMSFSCTIPIIMGSNIGTTLTSWILSLTGIKTDNFFLLLLKPDSFSLIFAFVGIIMIMLYKSNRRKSIGTMLVGFALLMLGMNLMSSALSPIAQMQSFSKLLVTFENPIMGVLIGTLFTAAIQSSAASIGILQALSLTGSVSFKMAVPIIMGQNIGTCITAVISSVGVSINAKKVAVLHVFFNAIGTAICLIIFCAAYHLIDLPFINNSVNPPIIAAIHSVFNIVTTAMLLPFTSTLEKLINSIFRK